MDGQVLLTVSRTRITAYLLLTRKATGYPCITPLPNLILVGHHETFGEVEAAAQELFKKERLDSLPYRRKSIIVLMFHRPHQGEEHGEDCWEDVQFFPDQIGLKAAA